LKFVMKIMCCNMERGRGEGGGRERPGGTFEGVTFEVSHEKHFLMKNMCNLERESARARASERARERERETWWNI